MITIKPLLACAACTIAMAAIINNSKLRGDLADINPAIADPVVEMLPATSKPAIIQKWELPEMLTEISGIAYLGAGKFACVQDEQGKIFIYNTTTGSIEKDNWFAPAADYEGITVKGNTAYVLHSGGKLFEVREYADKPSISIHETFKKGKQNVEGLCYDKQHDRLLLAIKRNDPEGKNKKNIYSFDLQAKKFDPAPVYKIDLTDNIWKGQQPIQPSDLAIHPVTGDIYILDAEHPRLLILNSAGKIKDLYSLDDPAFSMPEGISFSKDGDLYISNEGGRGKANILLVKING